MTLKRDVEEDVMLSGMMMLGAVICNAQVQIHEDIELPLRHPKQFRHLSVWSPQQGG